MNKKLAGVMVAGILTGVLITSFLAATDRVAYAERQNKIDQLIQNEIQVSQKANSQGGCGSQPTNEAVKNNTI